MKIALHLEQIWPRYHGKYCASRIRKGEERCEKISRTMSAGMVKPCTFNGLLILLREKPEFRTLNIYMKQHESYAARDFCLELPLASSWIDIGNCMTLKSIGSNDLINRKSILLSLHNDSRLFNTAGGPFQDKSVYISNSRRLSTLLSIVELRCVTIFCTASRSLASISDRQFKDNERKRRSGSSCRPSMPGSDPASHLTRWTRNSSCHSNNFSRFGVCDKIA